MDLDSIAVLYDGRRTLTAARLTLVDIATGQPLRFVTDVDVTLRFRADTVEAGSAHAPEARVVALVELAHNDSGSIVLDDDGSRCKVRHALTEVR